MCPTQPLSHMLNTPFTIEGFLFVWFSFHCQFVKKETISIFISCFFITLSA